MTAQKSTYSVSGISENFTQPGISENFTEPPTEQSFDIRCYNRWIILVLGKLGPGHSGPGQLGLIVHFFGWTVESIISLFFLINTKNIQYTTN